MKRLSDELREKYPGKAEKAASGSRANAIYLFCRECMGNSFKDVKTCASTDCFLWPYRNPAGIEYPDEELANPFD